jgi:uncharacterized protein with PIN domain
MTLQRLVEVEAKPKRTGSRALVRLTACPRCSQPLESVTHSMPALFRHSGYGAVRTTVAWFCRRCRFQGGHHTTETNPRWLA